MYKRKAGAAPLHLGKKQYRRKLDMSKEITQNTAKNKKEEITKKRKKIIKIGRIKIASIIAIFLFFNLTIDLEILPFWLSLLISLTAMGLLNNFDVSIKKLKDEISEINNN
ncbi:UNVERIFIED_CONTAM: hypothetical protein BEN50_18180 [Euhalothece sp. KZN 001]